MAWQDGGWFGTVALGDFEILRWRIRHRTASRSSYIDTMAQALAEMLDEVDGLIDRVQTQAANPEVRTLGVQHVKSLGASVAVTAVLETEVHRGSES